MSATWIPPASHLKKRAPRLQISNLVKFLDSSGVADYQVKGDSVYVPEGRSEALQTQLALSGNLNSGFLYESYRDGIGAASHLKKRAPRLQGNAHQLVIHVQRLVAHLHQQDGGVAGLGGGQGQVRRIVQLAAAPVSSWF